MTETFQTQLPLPEATEFALRNGGINLLGQPQRFLSILLDVADPSAPEIGILAYNTDEALLSPYARATLGKTPTTDDLETAAHMAARHLIDERHIDKAQATTCAFQLAEGIARFLQISAPQNSLVEQGNPTRPEGFAKGETREAQPKASPASDGPVPKTPKVQQGVVASYEHGPAMRNTPQGQWETAAFPGQGPVGNAMPQGQQATAAFPGQGQGGATMPQVPPVAPYVPTPPQPRRKAGLIVAILALATVMGIIGVSVGFLLRPASSPAVQSRDIPDVLGMTKKEATESITKDGFFELGVVSEDYSNEVEKGLVMEQNPDGGSSMTEGTAIDLVISAGKEPETSVSVPSVVGLEEDDAVRQLADAGFVTQRQYEWDSTYSKGIVMEQSPTGSAKAGSTISITISKGAEAKADDPEEPEPDTPEPETPEPTTPEPEEPDPVTPDPVTPDPVTPDPATPATTIYAAGDSINIRALPQHESALVATVDASKPLTYYGETGEGYGSDGGWYTWYHVYFDGTSGWIRSDLSSLGSTPSTPSSETRTIYAASDGINIRALPQHESALVATVDASKPLTYYGETGEGYGSDGGWYTWYHVYFDGTSGWIRSDLASFR